MDGLLISELAERSGFSASALRYYEQAGLLPAAERTPGGYRTYGSEAVDRLRFIARAKQLGLPLDEIRELAAVWDAGSCAPVQDRLVTLLGEKVTEVQSRIAELTAFAAQLTAARDALVGSPTPEGPCDDGCGCLADSAGRPTGPQPVRLLAARPPTPTGGTVGPAAARP